MAKFIEPTRTLSSKLKNSLPSVRRLARHEPILLFIPKIGSKLFHCTTVKFDNGSELKTAPAIRVFYEKDCKLYDAFIVASILFAYAYLDSLEEFEDCDFVCLEYGISQNTNKPDIRFFKYNTQMSDLWNNRISVVKENFAECITNSIYSYEIAEDNSNLFEQIVNERAKAKEAIGNKTTDMFFDAIKAMSGDK